MAELPIKQLKYPNPPSYKTVPSYRPYLREASNYSCSYCGIFEGESSGATFNIDHFRPKTFFPKLETKCSNLRYSCPRCNAYKSDNWIESKQCIRDCSNCRTKACTKNIKRFIDILVEDPSQIMDLSEDDSICAHSNSQVAEYTISYLRLNRTQLVRMRKIRRFMEKWERELNDMLTSIDNAVEEVQAQRAEFVNNASKDVDNTYCKMIIMMFEILEKHHNNSRLFIEEELRKLRALKDSTWGRDDNSSPIE